MNNKSVLFGVLVAAVVVFSGCAGFEGDIPMETLPNTVYISPANQDGIQDRLELNLDIPQIRGLAIRSYRFELRDRTGREIFVQNDQLASDTKVFVVQSPLVIPEKIVWDGRLSDGSWAADGEYNYQVVVKSMKDQQGASPVYKVVVDNAPPRLSVSAPYTLFSPNGDGRLDALPIYQQQSSVEDLWNGTLSDSTGKTIKQMNWNGMAANFNWDGTDNQGGVVADGEYQYRITSTDKAGNSYTGSLSGIMVDSSISRISLVSRTPVFSPNGDGVMDTMILIPTVERSQGIEKWTLSIVNSQGSVQRIWTGTEPVSSLSFNGIDENGKRIPDGDYYGRLRVEYVNGDSPETASDRFIVDTQAPNAAFSADFRLFSPDGDGWKDSVTINQSSSVEGKWFAKIVDSAGIVQKTAEWNERLLPFSWDGKNLQGRIVPDGVYNYEVSARDWAGNEFSGGFKGITVDSRSTPVSLSAGASGLSPNGDGWADTIRFVPKPLIQEGISSWSFSLSAVDIDSDWTLEGNSQPLPEVISWDGRNSSGKVADGLYKATLLVEYDKGNRTETALDTFVVVDTTPPVLKLNYGPLPFSPDSDGFNDVLSFEPEVTDVSPIVSWKLDIADSHGTPFHNVGNSGKPENFLWNGRSGSGELVLSAEDYSITGEAVDAYGNRGQYNGILPVDILVLRDGDRLRISISNIYFKPYTADYRDIDPVLAQKNIETLNRLADILAKYRSYTIRLEGHAVRIFWDNPEKWRNEERDILGPLSKERAEVIKSALVARGIPASRMTSTGLGGNQPIVPHSDLDNRWKNRRVEFLLVR